MIQTIKKQLTHILLLLPVLAFANEEPIEFQSDKIQYNHNNFEVTYQGNVVIKQGNKKLTGNTVKAKQNTNHGVEIAILSGLPAQLDMVEENGITTSAEAEKIILLPHKQKIVLLGNSIFHYDHEQLTGKKMTVHFQKESHTNSIKQER